MSLPSNGIAAEVIREMMLLYHLSDDLLQPTFAVLAPPPWRGRHSGWDGWLGSGNPDTTPCNSLSAGACDRACERVGLRP